MNDVPIDPALLESANRWFDISWHGLLWAGGVTALAACATVTFLFIQFWSSGVRERHSEWRTSALELQTEQAKRDAAKANEAAAGLNERAASLEREAAALRLQLDREIQKRAQRILQGEQRAAMIAELKGKITEIALVVQNDLETQAFSVQFLSIFAEIGATIYAPESPAEDKWWAPNGLIMYSPLGSNEDQLRTIRYIVPSNKLTYLAEQQVSHLPAPARGDHLRQSYRDTMGMSYTLARSRHSDPASAGCYTETFCRGWLP